MPDKFKIKAGIGAAAAAVTLMMLIRRRRAKRRAAAAEAETKTKQQLRKAQERASPLPFTFKDDTGIFSLGSTRDVSATLSFTPILRKKDTTTIEGDHPEIKKENNDTISVGVDTGNYILVHDYAPLENLLEMDAKFNESIPDFESYLGTVCPFFRGEDGGDELAIVRALQADGFHYAYTKKHLVYTRFCPRSKCSVTVVIALGVVEQQQPSLESPKEETGKPIVQAIMFKNASSFTGTTPAGCMEVVGYGRDDQTAEGAPSVSSSKFIYTNKDLGIRFGGTWVKEEEEQDHQGEQEESAATTATTDFPLEDVIESRLSSNPSVVYFIHGNPSADVLKKKKKLNNNESSAATAENKNISLKHKVNLIFSEVPFPADWAEKNTDEKFINNGLVDKEEKKDLDAQLKRDTALHFTKWESVHSQIDAGEADSSSYTEVSISTFGNLRCATFDEISSLLLRASELSPTSPPSSSDEILALKSRHWIIPVKGKLFSIVWECPLVLWEEELPTMRKFFDGFHLLA